jgi:hypothetical protein
VIAVRYRGRIGPAARLEEAEDRIVDLALAVGGQARVVRKRGAHGKRLVRGLDVLLWPGLEVLSLAVSPEGFLIPLAQVELAAERPVEEARWLATRTDHATPEAHVALVELLRWLARQPGVELEVEEHGRFPAAEIVPEKVDSTRALVRRTLERPSEHAPPSLTEHPVDDTKDGTDAEWDAIFRENERRMERIARRMEGGWDGSDPVAALEAAFAAEGIGALPVSLDDDALDGEDEEPGSDFDDLDGSSESELPDESWRGDHDPFEDRPPLQRRATELVCRMGELAPLAGSEAEGFYSGAYRGILEVAGGLAQALGDEDLDIPVGLRRAQIRRALRGAHHARRGLGALRGLGVIGDAALEELSGEVEAIESEATDVLRSTDDELSI